LSYRGNSKGSYGSQSRHGLSGSKFGRGKKGFNRETQIAREAFEKRSMRSQAQDLVRMADIAPSLEAYLKAPNKYDFPNVDMPDPKLIFSHKTAREQAADLAKCATKAPVEVWIKDTAKHDLEGVDTPNNKDKAKISEKTRKFKVVKKEQKKAEVEKELKKAEEKTKAEVKELAKAEANNPIIESNHKLPSEAEILAEAQRLYQQENFKPIHEETMPETMPTKGELSEEGYLQTAKLNLMTKGDTKNERQVFDYVENIRNELQKIGFDVVPISGFDSVDLQF